MDRVGPNRDFQIQTIRRVLCSDYRVYIGILCVIYNQKLARDRVEFMTWLNLPLIKRKSNNRARGVASAYRIIPLC